jgi:hypothetical protein
MPPSRLWLFLTILIAAGPASLAALEHSSSNAKETPVLRLDRLGEGTATLDGLWQFHLGDDPVWASPELDDATGHNGWETISADRPWGGQGHLRYGGFAWYRRHIQLTHCDNSSAQLSLLIERVDDAYEVYWNGQQLGSFGKPPPDRVALSENYEVGPQVFRFNPIAGSHSSSPPIAACDGVLAIRVFKMPRRAIPGSAELGGMRAAPVLGSAKSIEDLRGRLRYDWLRSHLFFFAQELLIALLMLISFGAWLRKRNQPLLFWLASLFLASLMYILPHYWPVQLDSSLYLEYAQFTWMLLNVSLLYLLLHLMNLEADRRLVRATRFAAWLNVATLFLYFMLAWLDSMNWRPDVCRWAGAACDAVYYPLQLFPLAMVVLGLRRRLTPERIAVVVFVFIDQLLVQLFDFFMEIQRYTTGRLARRVAAPLFTIAGNRFDAITIANLLMLASIAYAVYRQTRHAAHRQTVLELEFRNARVVQQVLVPEEIPHIPGFEIEAIYRPFGEVGGDFFQILPIAGGGALVVIGDVSGKGMPAAMMVSLLVGTVRTLAHYTQSPGEILAAMNARMIGRSNGGFTTCLVLRADSNGTLTVANAGHLAPYVAGKELQVESGLPLGLAADVGYVEATFTFGADERLTLVTDGVLEARAADGELLGFERMAELSVGTAADIAQAAQGFGQDDDITVLTVRRVPECA